MEPVVRSFVASLKANLNSEHEAALEACLNCRQCGSACAWYLGTGRADLHPKYKKDFIRDLVRRHLTWWGRLLGFLGFAPAATPADLRAHMEYYWKCTACGRCTLACPLGLSNRAVTRLARAAYADAGLSRENPTLNAVWQGTETAGHSFGLPAERLRFRLKFFLAHEGVQTTWDRIGAEYLFCFSAAGTAKFPDYAPKILKLFNAAGVDYTLSPTVFDTGTDIDHIVAQRTLTRDMLEGVEAEAARLQVRRLIIDECACDVRTFYMEVHKTLGRPFRFPVISLDALLLELIESGRLPVARVPQTLTLHDPCYATRLSGLGALERRLLNAVAENFIEMTPHGGDNFCCNGGVGPMRMPENAALRREVSKFKAEQIRRTRAEWVVTPCAVCTLSLSDTCQVYGLAAPGHRKVFLMFEIVYAAVAAALARLENEEAMNFPQSWKYGPGLTFLPEASGNRRESRARLAAEANFGALLKWLARDEFANRYLWDHPEAIFTLQALQKENAQQQRTEAGA